MNTETHICNQMEAKISRSIKGNLAGEYSINELEADGRCRFVSEDGKTLLLCYYREGRRQKGPFLKNQHDCIKTKIVVRSGNCKINGDDCYMEGVVSLTKRYPFPV